MKNTKLHSILLGIAALGLALQAQAQLPVGSHYPAGAEGIKGASLPPPGVYLRDYNFFYTASKVDGGPPGVDIFAYVQAPRLIWMTEKTFLGASYGMDVIVPFAYKDISGTLGSANQFNLGDIQVEPLLLAWHKENLDLAVGYALWIPTGKFDTSSAAKQLTSPGSGFFTHMLTAGGTWYADKEKTWALSLLGRYEINHEQKDTHVTPGNMATLEWGLSKTVCKGVDLGLVGYYQQQITKDSGSGASTELSRVVAFGPEINAFWSKLGVFTSLRYNYEVEAKNRPQGHTVTFTLTKRF